LADILGEGAFGVVLKAEAHGIDGDKNDKTTVAVKTLKGSLIFILTVFCLSCNFIFNLHFARSFVCLFMSCGLLTRKQSDTNKISINIFKAGVNGVQLDLKVVSQGHRASENLRRITHADTGLLHCTMNLFAPQLLLVLTVCFYLWNEGWPG